MLDNIITMVIGDWSNDGHGRTTTLVFKSNLTTGQVEADPSYVPPPKPTPEPAPEITEPTE